ncbi:SAF domain-containing protein [Nocardioides daphniae]|uniref:Membrane protein n=1 Tax=Nocardioides daphniae TaxID=402297 RepID=A0A4P7UB81_9ACTN|nr:SAF domain-containing protein [Nocardioides daphniae]QCC77412.1 hypothetical protein E2C04_09855 [Nocardioides daphniae]GGD24508.1 membrane protein [Nocardioides daphniae]
MSNTATRTEMVNDPESTRSNPLVPPPKLRRRPALVVAAAVAILLGALLGGWAWTATTNTEELLVARTTIERGAVIEADDLARVQVNADPALSPVPASLFDEIVGQRAAYDIAAGVLLTPQTYTRSLIPDAGSSIVGVALTPAQAPGLALSPGDRVRVVVTPALGDTPPTGGESFSEATVAGVHVSQETGQTVVDVLVPHAEAALVAARAATGNVALVLDSRER